MTYWNINNIEIQAVKNTSKKRLVKNEIEFCPKNDNNEKKKVVRKIITTKLPVNIAHPNNNGIENIKVPARLDLIAFIAPYWL